MQQKAQENEVVNKCEISLFKKPSNFEELFQKGKQQYSQIANEMIQQNICYQCNGINMKFKVYKGQSCILMDSQSQKKFTVLIQNFVITSFEKNTIHILVKAQLYYTKNDLMKQYEDIMKECLENDLFLTNISAWFYAPYIEKIISVKPIEDFIKGTCIWDKNYYWIRSEYDALNNSFKQDYHTWQRECYCNLLCNPTLYENNITYCKLCSFVFHKSCVQLVCKKSAKLNVLCQDCKKYMRPPIKNIEDIVVIQKKIKKQ